MKIDQQKHQQLRQRIAAMEKQREHWWTLWREVSDYFLPRRYPWLLTDKETKSAGVRNRRLLDSTSTTALRTLATGMMNGITSPARPWFRLRLQGFEEEAVPHAALLWLEEASKRMMQLMGETNFYNSIGILYLEWSAFGTASMGIYEDFKDVFRCRNYALGEFYISTDKDKRVNRHARKFRLTVEQAAQEFGVENLSKQHREDYEAGIPRRLNLMTILHLVEPNDPDDPWVRPSAQWRELYWTDGSAEPELLAARPLDEFPIIPPRWETYADDEYGSSPCMEALPDVIQLQHLVKRRAQGLDKLITPPMLAHSSLASRPKAFTPGGITYVNSQDLQQGGARPTYQIQVPFDQLNGDIAATQQRIKQVLFNDLFRMITELDTVRSATEIDARREEKLVLLGPVLERFEAEGLAPCIERIFRICERAGMFPPAPPELADQEIEIQYVSMLADAQRAVGTVAVERWLQLIGNVAQMAPEVLEIPDWEELIRDYGDDIGVKQKHKRSREEVAEARAQREQEEALASAAEQGQALASGAESLSNTDLGGGQNALQAMLG